MRRRITSSIAQELVLLNESDASEVLGMIHEQHVSIREYDTRDLPGASLLGREGSLRLDSLMHRGREWATLHSVATCVAMLAVATPSWG